MNAQHLDDELMAFVRKFRNLGYAVVIFAPHEVGDLHPQDLERHMIEEGSALVELLSEDDSRVED